MWGKRLDSSIDDIVGNDACLYVIVSLMEEFVEEHNSEALADIIMPHGSFVPYNIFQTLPFSYNLHAVNFKDKCGIDAWKSVSHLSYIHPEGFCMLF